MSSRHGPFEKGKDTNQAYLRGIFSEEYMSKPMQETGEKGITMN